MTVQLNAAEIAAFAVDVFEDVTDIARRLPPGFVRLAGVAGASADGFAAAAYFNAATGQLVVAYRGDESLRSEFNNLSFVAEGSGTAFEAALAFAGAARVAAESSGGVSVGASAVTFTGHGIGGGLAALVAAASGAEATTFNGVRIGALVAGLQERLGTLPTRFDFKEIVSSFDAARAATNISRWQVMNSLLDAHVWGSDGAALGGGLSAIAVSAVQQIIGDSGFGASAQELHSLDSLTQGTVKLG